MAFVAEDMSAMDLRWRIRTGEGMSSVPFLPPMEDTDALYRAFYAACDLFLPPMEDINALWLIPPPANGNFLPPMEEIHCKV